MHESDGDGGTGHESVAVVEFAPFQKAPPEKKKIDSRMGTIDQGKFRTLLLGS